MYEEKFMREAIRLAVENVKQGTGGPFGAVVVKEGKIIAACANTVTPDCDPTAHAEVNAIREACRKLDTFQLGGCVYMPVVSLSYVPWCYLLGKTFPGYIMPLQKKMQHLPDSMIP